MSDQPAANWSLLFRRRFGPILFIQTFAGFSNNFFKTATYVAITYLFYPGDPNLAGTVTALVAAASALPHFLFASIAGQFGDRMDRARLARIIRGIDVMVMLGAAIALQSKLVAALLLIVFFAGTRATFYSPLRYSILPRLLDRGQLLFATGVIQAAIVVAAFGGQVAGGLTEPYSAGMILVAISFVCFLASLLIPAVPSEDPTVRIDWNIARGLHHLVRRALVEPQIRLAVLGISAIDASGAILLSQFAPLVRQTIGGTPAVVSLFFGAFAAGTAIGALWVARLLKGEISTRLAPWTLLLMGSVTAALWAAAISFPRDEPIGVHAFMTSGYWPMLLLAALLAACASILSVPLYGLLQTGGRSVERNRYVSANNILNAIAILLASAIVTLALGRGLKPSDILIGFSLPVVGIGAVLVGRKFGVRN